MAFQVLQVGPEVGVNEIAAGDQQTPSVTALENGGWVVTWASQAQDGTGLNIHQRLYDPEGVPFAEALVNQETLLDQSFPCVTALPDGGSLVTWQSGSPPDIVQRRFKANGDPDGDEAPVNEMTGSIQALAQVAALADGGWVVTWTSLLNGSDLEIFQRRFDATGNTSGPDIPVNTFTNGIQRFSGVAALADGGWVIAWESDGQDGAQTGIFQQRFDALGQPTGGETPVNAFVDNEQSGLTLAGLADGGWVVAWKSVGADGDTDGIVMRRFDSTGATVGPDLVVNGTTSGLQNQPSVAALADGGWVVTWTSALQDGSGLGVFQRLYDSTGASSGPDLLVNAFTEGHQSASAVAAFADGGFVIAWQSDGQDGSGSGIYQRRYAGKPPGQLTDGQDLATGTGADDMIEGTPQTLNPGDVINGGGGFDTLALTGAGFDLTTVTVAGLEAIVLTHPGGASVVVDDKAVAASLSAAVGQPNDQLILAGGVFTVAERNALFKNGFDVVIDAGAPAGGYVSLAPTAITLSTHTISEATQGGGIVAQLGAVDSNPWDQDFTFEIHQNPAGLFAIHGTALKLAPGASLDFESLGPASFTLKLRVTDPGGRTFDQEVTLTLANANEAVTAIGLAGDTVQELARANAIVGTLTASDMDPGDTLTFEIVNDAGGRFDVSGNSLVVKNGIALDYEQKTTHTVRVRATDAGGLSFEQDLVVRILDLSKEKTSGSPGADRIVGGKLADSLGGGAGNDVLLGRLGNDTLTGGKGKDTFVFDTKPHAVRNVDRITDFSAKDDAIWLDNAVFRALGAGTSAKPKKLSADAFHAGKAAQDAKDRILYDKATGSLFYDPDGTGAAQAIKFAIIGTKAAVTYNDFFVI